jgi:peroxiredoxin
MFYLHKLVLSLCCLFIFQAGATAQQTIPDFTVTDVDGQVHRLYADYLDQNKVVAIKFFFTTCPPCISNAPSWQQKYVQWGSGSQGVEFFNFTTISSDNNAAVINFENAHGQTMKGISSTGGSLNVVNPFKSGTYGSWYGTPSFVVIAPDRTIQYPVFFNELDAAIQEAQGNTTIPPTTVNLVLPPDFNTIPEGHVKFFIVPANQSTSKVEISKNNQGIYSFSYPSAQYPEMNNPEIFMESFGPAYTTKVSASDVLAIQKHILQLSALDSPAKLLAADVNTDNKITANDMLNIRKVILGISAGFPNNTPSYKSIPERRTFSANPGNTVNLDFTIVKMGNVN